MTPNRTQRMARALVALLLAAPLLSLPARAQGVGSFTVTLGEGLLDGAYSGPLYVAFAAEGEPREAMHSWFGAPPVLRFEVDGLAPGRSVTFAASDAVSHAPRDWTEVGPGPWRVQAIARVSRTGREAGLDEGDLHSTVATIDHDPASSEAVVLTLDQAVPPTPFPEGDRFREFVFTSPALSAFHGFDYELRAGVRLPLDHDPESRYPVLYSVTGFGGTHRSVTRWERSIEPGSILDHCLVVVPDASNRFGHSVFVDSPSIGPWGQALVHELIPALEAEFGGAGAEQRYVTGVSSGGWSSLWLQVAYPEAFAGCWSHAPDPIDFHDFQQIDLYEPLPSGAPRNMYVDEQGQPRPLARRNGVVMLTYEDFVRREHVLNPGGQIRSFEGTFSPLGADGTPRRVFDVETGVIDHEAARAWRSFDISHTLLTGWDELRPRLSGKLHVYAGGEDTFYLEGAVERFRRLAEPAGLLEDMVVEVVPGMPHTRYPAGHEAMQRTIEERWGSQDS